MGYMEKIPGLITLVFSETRVKNGHTANLFELKQRLPNNPFLKPTESDKLSTKTSKNEILTIVQSASHEKSKPKVCLDDSLREEL